MSASPIRGILQKVGTAILTLLVLLVIAFLIWFYLILDWREETIDAGFSEAANRNRFLGAQLFLERAGIESEQRNTLAPLGRLGTAESEIDDNDTVILIESYGALYGERLNNVLAWVSRGGELVLSSRNEFYGDPDFLSDVVFDSLGVVAFTTDMAGFSPYDDFVEERQLVFQSEDLEDFEELDDVAEERAARTVAEAIEDIFDAGDFLACFENAPVTPWQLNETGEELTLQFLGDVGLYDNEEFPAQTIGDPRGIQLYATDYGDGSVVLTTDNQLWSNYRIGCYDHAYLLHRLSNGSGKVWFLSNFGSDSLFAILWRNFSIALLFLMACLFGWLWYRGSRFGPILDRTMQHRRSLLEHTDATANFLYQRGRAASLIQELQQEIMRRVDLRYRGFSRLQRERQIQILHEITRCAPEDVAFALQQAEQLNQVEFQQQVRACQRIRMRL